MLGFHVEESKIPSPAMERFQKTYWRMKCLHPGEDIKLLGQRIDKRAKENLK